MKHLPVAIAFFASFSFLLVEANGQQVNHVAGDLFSGAFDEEIFALNASGDATGDGGGNIVLALENQVFALGFGIEGSRAYENFDFVNAIGFLGDIDADGFGDLLFGQENALDQLGSVTAVSGDTGAVLFSITSPGSNFFGFGHAVAVLGDTNGDGVTDFAASAPFSDTPHVGVYSGDDGRLLLTIRNANQGTWGQSLAATGDVNDDGAADMLIGSPNGLVGGAAYVISGATGEIIDSLGFGLQHDSFGFSAATAGDVNADGHADFLVGAPGLGDGIVCVYSGFDGSQLFQLIGSFFGASSFGFSVSGAGDLNGDGRSDVIVGDPDANLAIAFSGVNGTVLYVGFGSGAEFDAYGQYVSGGADVNSDGFPDFVIGASEGAVDSDEGYFDTFLSNVIGTFLGDVDLDGDVDADDIDFYGENLGAPALLNIRMKFAELGDNGSVLFTIEDHDLLIQRHVQTSNGSTGTFVGDINLDGAVDVLGDAFILIANLGRTGVGYASGDLNADQRVDVLGDAFRLIGNLGSHGGIL